VPVIIRDASEQEKLALALIENVQRKDLNPIERAWGFARLIEEFSLTQEEAAKKVGQSRASLTNALRLLKLPEQIQKSLIDGVISEGHAKVLLSVSDKDQQLSLFRRIVKDQLSVRSTESHVRSHGSIRPHQASDPNIRDAEERLQRSLGTKVEIKKSGGKGSIVISWFSLEELHELIRRITQGR